MAITPQQVNDSLKYVVDTAKTVKHFSKIAKRSSIMKMAAPAMYQYPVMMSNAIETPVAMAISQAYQQTYANSVVTAYSLNPNMYLKDYEEPSEFVQKFHNNNGAFNFSAMATALGVVESVTNTDNLEIEMDIVNAEINKTFNKEALESLSIRAWDRVEDYVDTSVLNDSYRPYDRTHRILSEKVEALQTANEGLGDVANSIGDKIDKTIKTMDDINQTVTNNPNDKPYNPKKEVHSLTERANSIVRNDKLDAMEPTMVNVQIVCHGKKQGVYKQNLTIGVKTMLRLIGSDLMTATMVEACKESNSIFKFLNWTKGEQKTLDFVLGISDAKKKALEKNAKMEVQLLKQSKKRGKHGLLRRALRNEVFPILTVVITSYEAERIKEICGVDLTDFRQATNLMNKYYLLSFAIYDQTQNTLQTIFDCDNDWSIVSIGSMKSMINKVTDVLNQKEIMGIFNRMG